MEAAGPGAAAAVEDGSDGEWQPEQPTRAAARNSDSGTTVGEDCEPAELAAVAKVSKALW